MKLKTAFYSLLILFFAFIPQAQAADSFIGAELSFSLQDTLYSINTYQNKSKSIYQFFLPSFTEECDATIALHFSKADSPLINVHLVPEEALTCEYNGKSYTFQTVKSANIPALSIDISSSGGLSLLNKSKQNVLKGSLLLVNSEGEIAYQGNIASIKGRGNMSWDLAKKGYGFKLETKVDLLGMGKEKSWVLIPTYRDNSLLNFRIINDLALACGIDFAQQSRYVDLYIDHTYLGVYLLTEKNNIGKNRINITDLEAATAKVNELPLEQYTRKRKSTIGKTGASGYYWTIPNEPQDITGGYLLELDTYDKAQGESSVFGSSGGLVLTVKSPEHLTEGELTYIATFWQDFENALYSKNGINNKGKHYSDYIDEESFALLWLLDELGMELDVCSSHYFWKDSDLTGDGKLHACAPWDVEHCFKREKAAGDYLPNNGAPKRFWQNMYNLHKEFQATVCKVWQEKLYPALCDLLDPNNDTPLYEGMCSFDTYVSFIDSAACMNHLRWPSALSSQIDDRNCKTWEDSVAFVRKFITNRTAYMNTVYGKTE